MIRKQISLFLKNVPGELGKLAALLGGRQINIEALSIQDASAYVSELINARGKSIKRIASTQSYDSMRRDSEEFALMRFLVDKTEEAVEFLAKEGYFFDVAPVIALNLENRPGVLAEIASKFGQEGLNIKYVYGSATEIGTSALFVLCPDDLDLAAKVFNL
ncbi:MAG: ACT domain-containing protein [Thermodesulfobacteriota bacterium]